MTGEIINMQTQATTLIVNSTSTIEARNEVLLNSTVRIYLTDQQLTAFKGFENYYQDLVTMLDAGVFSFTNGQAIIHRDSTGGLRRITFELVKYDRRHKD